MKRLSLLSVLLFSSAVSMAQKSVVSDEHYTMLNIDPLRLDDEAVSAADALELYNKAGVRYPLYSLTLHPEGRPAMAKIARGDTDEAKAALKLAEGAVKKLMSVTEPEGKVLAGFSQHPTARLRCVKKVVRQLS